MIYVVRDHLEKLWTMPDFSALGPAATGCTEIIDLRGRTVIAVVLDQSEANAASSIGKSVEMSVCVAQRLCWYPISI